MPNMMAALPNIGGALCSAQTTPEPDRGRGVAHEGERAQVVVKCTAGWCHGTKDSKVIAETFFPADLLASTEETKSNRTKASNTRTKWH